MALILALAVIGVMVLQHAGRDRIAAAQMGSKERAFACAEAGLQYGRRYFGLNYEASHGWNDYLNGTVPGYTYTATPSLSSVPKQVRGMSDGSTLDVGAGYNGSSQFWVSIRDDDDERPSGLGDDPTRDNNEAVILRSECTAFYYLEGGEQRTAALEVLLSHVQNASGYGNAQITSNSPDVLGQLGTK
jgi:Tfp pilus assembly protein PilX